MKKDEMKKDDTQCVNPDNASHNLDSKLKDQRRRPSRDVAEADFAAEAHGFTAFENTGQGSRYQGGALDEETEDETNDAAGDGDGSDRPGD
ncbi:MAG TPA: hypothetical protein VKO85_03630 [Wenzhouxiangellaceae bacterium]|nr:hypothetical protein [Wenzhouxiangellaceae bacterium]